MFDRTLNLAELAQKKSLFLFGPRSTGKTTLLRSQFSDGAIINLLKSSVYLPLAANPSLLGEVVRDMRRAHPVIIIDEIQKLPPLLDEVHDLIEREGIRFVLTGSSARKLKRSGVNLLAGRAWQTNLFPLSSAEIPDFDINRYLRFGGLPQVYTSDWPEEELDAYLNTYLKEEIQAEALVHQLTHFSRFLKTAAACHAEQVNFANVASDSGIPASTVKGYFSILEDTFTGSMLPAWRASTKRKAVATPKFYFFDPGVANFLRGQTTLGENSAEFGKAFEHFILMEIQSCLSYRRIRKEISYWRTQGGTEVDFLIGNDTAIEVKASRNISNKHLKGLRALKEEGQFKQFFLVSFDETNRETDDGIRLLYWKSFTEKLWGNGEILCPSP
jgi:predicted AAA+ superfamily ATPase